MMRDPLMDEALELARQGLGRTSPNPTVGAVLVKDGQIVGRGFHTYTRAKHAEVVALEDAESAGGARGATLYVTLEPCSHHGRTPPCADALVSAGITRVIAAMEDPNPQVAGQGFRRLHDAGIEVEVAAEYTDEASRLNEAFIHSMRTGLPLVTLKAALTLDGKISAPEDNTGWITSERARAHVQQIRHNADAILTGIGTVLSDDPLLTDRTGEERSRPLLRIVADSTLRIPLDSRMVTSANGDLAVVTTSAASDERRRALEYRGVRVLVFDGPGGRADLTRLPAFLAAEHYRSLMIESGSKLNWAVLESRIADKIFFYYAPKILGGLRSLPVAGGTGRLRRTDAIQFHNVRIHSIPPDEFVVEAWVDK
ncbi:MAG TPA: bifunctional diaminohydroxyphosphoribosylaminopyrimidine deaminase/5-amino-6-(5-phosphoribosylamino)uracil reductase RibD [Bryobacteraceae bacterium]|nr:bifunctional diaminohydroxyphosphoribosylaminopyrimidine deaminase/5-amino-6-(5-phosphoribosylamino)uracil reductase RibD [Bryobacteraceae bacterium]